MILSIFNQKGGVGKTTTAVNLAHALARNGKRVLLLDLDAQANASALLGVRDAGRSIFDALVAPDDVPLSDIFTDVGENLTLAPGARAMAGLEAALRDQALPQLILREALTATDFDFVICDNGPTLGLPAVMSLVAADVAVIPLQCERLALEGLAQAFKTVETVKRQINPNLQTRVLLSMVDGRFADGKQVAAEVRESLGEAVLQSTISTSSKLKLGAPIFEFDSSSAPARDFIALAQEIQNIKLKA